MTERRIIKPEESKLAIAVQLSGHVSGNGPIFHLYELRTSPLLKIAGLKKDDLLASYAVLIASHSKRGGETGHYHRKKKELFVMLDGQLYFFLTDLKGDREIVNLDTRAESMPKGTEFKFHALYVPPDISHMIYNPADKPEIMTIYSRQSMMRTIRYRDSYDLDAVGAPLDQVVKELKLDQ